MFIKQISAQLMKEQGQITCHYSIKFYLFSLIHKFLRNLIRRKDHGLLPEQAESLVSFQIMASLK